MKVLIASTKTGTGSETFSRDLAKNLRKFNIEVIEKYLPLRVEYFPLIKIEEEADIVHSHSWIHPRAFKRDSKLLTTYHLCVHSDAFRAYKTLAQKLYHKLWISYIEKLNYRKASSNITISEKTKNEYKQTLNFSLNVIKNAVDINIFYPSKNKKLDKKIKILFASSFTKRKGSDLLVPIIDQLDDSFELICIGEKKIEHKNIKFIEKIKSRHEMAQLYRKIDILLLPSRLEGLPLTVLEAQASGVPAVASIESSSECIIHNKTGFLCRNIEDYVKYIKSLSDSDKYAYFSRNARKYIVKEFSIERLTKEYIREYLKILSKK